jgi:hypothetical protein
MLGFVLIITLCFAAGSFVLAVTLKVKVDELSLRVRHLEGEDLV